MLKQGYLAGSTLLSCLLCLLCLQCICVSFPLLTPAAQGALEYQDPGSLQPIAALCGSQSMKQQQRQRLPNLLGHHAVCQQGTSLHASNHLLALAARLELAMHQVPDLVQIT